MSEHNWNLDRIIAELRDVRRQSRRAQQRPADAGGRELPSREALRDITRAFCTAIFPMHLGPADMREETADFYVGHTLHTALNGLLTQARLELRYAEQQTERSDSALEARAVRIVQDFGAALPGLRVMLDADVMAAYVGDPAARSLDEILLCYPGIVAIIHHRLAHQLYKSGVPLLARMMAEAAHSDTGIDIHPGAQIGPGFFIDHGTGVVIGETAIIGERVRLYQAVTLGAKSFPVTATGELQKGLPRHPIVEDDVVIYAGATVLGRITIGRGSTIGGNVWLTRSVPPGSNITQASLQSNAAGGTDA
jgi:serine O-acetyltransferase